MGALVLLSITTFQNGIFFRSPYSSWVQSKKSPGAVRVNVTISCYCDYKNNVHKLEMLLQLLHNRDNNNKRTEDQGEGNKKIK